MSQEQLKVQYIFEERHRSMKENCLWGRCKQKVKKTNNSTFSATHKYIKQTLVSFFLLFFLCTFPYAFPGNFFPKRAKNDVFSLNKVKNGQKRPYNGPKRAKNA